MFLVFLVLSRSYYWGWGTCNSHNRLGEENVQLVEKVILVTLVAAVVNSALPVLVFGTGLTQAASIWGKGQETETHNWISRLLACPEVNEREKVADVVDMVVGFPLDDKLALWLPGVFHERGPASSQWV